MAQRAALAETISAADAARYGEAAGETGGAYLITGGLGGIGLALAAWLAKAASARLLLTSRRSLPPREAWEALLAEPAADEENAAIVKAIRDMEALGGTVMTAAADAADLAAMEAAIDKAREWWGEFDGVIHAAGVPGNGRLAVLQDRPGDPIGSCAESRWSSGAGAAAWERATGFHRVDELDQFDHGKSWHMRLCRGQRRVRQLRRERRAAGRLEACGRDQLGSMARDRDGCKSWLLRITCARRGTCF